jgi:outer membrane protein
VSRRLAAALLVCRALAAAAQSNPRADAALELSLREAVLLALENNSSLKTQRLVPEIRRTSVQEELGLLDPQLTAGASHGWPTAPTAGSKAEAELALSLASGTTVSASLGAGWDPVSASYDLQVTQSLLAGGRLVANLARVRQARLDVRASEHELRGFTASLVAGVQQAYWEHHLALRQREIYRESLALAERQLEESRIRVQVGQIAPIELAAPRAEVVSRKEALREGEKRVETTRLGLLLRLNLPETGLDASLRLADSPGAPAGPLDELSRHLALASRRRPELLQARLQLERGDLEVTRTRAGLLPRLDAFISLGGTGYAAAFGDTFAAAAEDSGLSAGLSLELALGNRTARARADRARLGRAQAEESLRGLERTVEADVRSAWLEAGFAAGRVSSSAELRALQEQTLAAETEKFRGGISTTFLVAQAQRDLLASQLAEAQAAVGYLLAVVNLYRLEGTLLERSGIEEEL